MVVSHTLHITYIKVQTCLVSTCCGRRDSLINSNDFGRRTFRREKLQLCSPTLGDRWFVLYHSCLSLSLDHKHAHTPTHRDTQLHKTLRTSTNTFLNAALTFPAAAFKSWTLHLPEWSFKKYYLYCFSKHTNYITSSTEQWCNVSVWSLHGLPMLASVLSRHSSFIPQFNNMYW